MDIYENFLRPFGSGKSYVMSDIHGCYDQYLQMLEKINFSDSDTLYVLGDAVDRGDKTAELLTDMSKRANIIPIMGNHEYMAVVILKRLLVEITDENSEIHLNKDILEKIGLWMQEGGDKTLSSIYKLPNDERMYMLEYLEEFSLYQVVEVADKLFVLTHAGVPIGATLNNLNSFDAYSFLTASMDYSKNYFGDAILITGHTPTGIIDEASKGKIYRRKNNIAIDTGGVFIGTFACLCLDTMEEFYVNDWDTGIPDPNPRGSRKMRFQQYE